MHIYKINVIKFHSTSIVFGGNMTLIIFLSGLLLFIGGIYTLQIGLQQASQGILPKVMYKWTKTPATSFITGTLATMVLQSSSAVTVIALSMVNTGIMRFEQSIGIILGTNIGTTITALILAFNLENLVLPILLLGLFLLIPNYTRPFGLALTGLSLLFIGMENMTKAFSFLQNNPRLKQLILGTAHPLRAVLVGTIVTAIIQSSSAISGMVIALAKNGQLDLLTATGIILGSNIGTCATALIAGIGTKTEAKRVAMAHILLNVIGVFLFLPFISQFAWLMASTSTSLPRQVANTHFFFNLFCSLALLPFIKPFSKLVCFLIKE